MKRWLTTSELGDVLAERSPRVAKLSRWRRAEYARRLVERAERLESVRCTKRNGRRLLISTNALALLLPTDAATVDRLDTEFGKLAQNQRALRRQVNGHGAQLITHAKRIKIVEQITDETAKFVARIGVLKAAL
jgi:hypothetical protein